MKFKIGIIVLFWFYSMAQSVFAQQTQSQSSVEKEEEEDTRLESETTTDSKHPVTTSPTILTDQEQEQTVTQVERKVRKEKKEEFSTDLQEALQMETWSATEEYTIDTQMKLKDLYRTVVTDVSTNPEEKAIAENNLANVLLREDKIESKRAAVSIFETIDAQNIPEEERFMFFYNYGRSLELTDHPDQSKALNLFLESLKLNPSYKSAQDRAEAILLANPVSVADSRNYIDQLNAVAAFDRSREFIWKQFHRTSGLNARQFLFELAENYTASSISITVFRETEIPKLQEKAARDESMQPLIKELIIAFTGQLSAHRIISGLRFSCSEFGRWRALDESRLFSRLLQKIGDSLYNDKLIEQAFTRYVCAWELDNNNTGPMVDAAAILQTNPSPENKELLESFLDQIFDLKTYEYVKHTRDREALVRLHTILATIYESQGDWTGNGPRNAIFQWEHAASNSKEVGKLENLPNIYAHLAKCYTQVNDKNKAAENYLLAAQILARKEGNLKLADEMISRAERLYEPAALPADLHPRIASLKSTIAELRAQRGY